MRYLENILSALGKNSVTKYCHDMEEIVSHLLNFFHMAVFYTRLQLWPGGNKPEGSTQDGKNLTQRYTSLNTQLFLDLLSARSLYYWDKRFIVYCWRCLLFSTKGIHLIQMNSFLIEVLIFYTTQVLEMNYFLNKLIQGGMFPLSALGSSEKQF